MSDESAEVELPHAVALAWGIAVAPARGPKRELSVERIVDFAVELADAGGLSAVSMSAVATGLGFTTMSLYRYVTAKDDLVLLMYEGALGVPSQEVSAAADWWSGLRLLARDIVAVYRAHPWMLDIPITGLPNTPNTLSWMDSGLAVLRDTPLTLTERMAAVLMVTGHARWQGMIERSYRENASATGVSPSDRDLQDARVLATLVSAEMFPWLREAIDAGVFVDEDDPFEFALGRSLDGMNSYMAARAAGLPRPVEPEPSADYPRNAEVKVARQLRREAESKLREAIKREKEAAAKALERQAEGQR